MITTDSLFFLVMFIVPGAVKIIYDVKLAKQPHQETNETLRLSQTIVFCAVVFSLNILIFKDVFTDFINTQADVLSATDTLLRVALINILSGMVYCFVWEKLKTLYRLVSNSLKTKNGISTTTEFPYAKDYAFSPANLGEVTCIVKVVQGETETVGQLAIYNEHYFDSNDIVLDHCNVVKMYFDMDAQCKDPNNLLFDEEKYTYFNFELGYKIIFYNNEKFLKYLESSSSSLSVE